MALSKWPTYVPWPVFIHNKSIQEGYCPFNAHIRIPRPPWRTIPSFASDASGKVEKGRSRPASLHFMVYKRLEIYRTLKSYTFSRLIFCATKAKLEFSVPLLSPKLQVPLLMSPSEMVYLHSLHTELYFPKSTLKNDNVS
jgi:hypothetical protein